MFLLLNLMLDLNTYLDSLADEDLTVFEPKLKIFRISGCNKSYKSPTLSVLLSGFLDINASN